MIARLYSRSGRFNGQSFEIDGATTIGRDDGNDIVLKSRTISSRHARIFPSEDGAGFLVEDLGSLNGTSVDGIRVVGAEPLGSLHVLTFGDRADFVFQVREAAVDGDTLNEEAEPQWPEDAGGPSPESPVTLVEEEPLVVPELGTDRPAEEATDESSTAGERAAESVPVETPTPEPRAPASLVFAAGGRERSLAEGEYVVGRGTESDLRLDDSSVSRRHAVLIWRGGRLAIRDLESSNGVWVDEERREGEFALELPASITFGAVDVSLREETP